MPYCKNCGAEVNENAAICTKCGAWINENPQTTLKVTKSGLWYCCFAFSSVALEYTVSM